MACDALRASCLQLGASLAQQRRQLTLFRHPVLTLYYLVACASAAAWRGVKWCLQHPIMLFIIVPVLATYLTLKSTGQSVCARHVLVHAGCLKLHYWTLRPALHATTKLTLPPSNSKGQCEGLWAATPCFFMSTQY